MRAVILAAGRGTRMGRYGENMPKGMLPFKGKTLIERQIDELRSIGLKDIVIATGYKSKMINYGGITYYHNADFADTNMVETLMCAREALDTDILVSYADIYYTKELAKAVIDCPRDIGVAVDENWREYWTLRYGTTEEDLESLSLSADGRIIEIGRPVSSSVDLNYRYIGLIKFSARGMRSAISLYDEKKAAGALWTQSRQPFEKGYMTDLLHGLIVAGVAVHPVVSQGGWFEFDTVHDYETVSALQNIDEYGLS